MRTLHDSLLAAQVVNATPYVYLSINGTDFSSRLLALEHVESPYRETADIRLDNHDRALDPDPNSPYTGMDLRGKKFTIGYGYKVAGGSNMYLGDGTNASMPNLWVKTQHITSVEGKVVCDLHCEGMWGKLRDMSYSVIPSDTNKVLSIVFASAAYASCVLTDIGKTVNAESTPLGTLISYDNTLRKWLFNSSVSSIGSGVSFTITSGTGAGTSSEASAEDIGEAPFFEVDFGGVQTVKELIALALAGADMSLNPTYTSDGIVDVIKPYFHFDASSLPSLASIIYNGNSGLLEMTKSYLRPEANDVFKLVYPVTDDPVLESYYSYQSPQFKEYTEKLSLLIPNDIKVYWGYESDAVTTWTNEEILSNIGDPGSALDSESIAAYDVCRQIHKFPHVATHEQADLIAEAILSKFKSETLAGRLVLPFHDCRVELYDRVGIYDKRGH